MTNIDIYSILSSKPHNAHYLLRYWKFIQSCAEQNKNIDPSVYTERHHICPKSSDLFPELNSFKQHPWNCAILTYRQHYIAHWILWKAYGGKQMVAFSYICLERPNQFNRTHSKLNSRTAAKLKMEFHILAGINSRGKATYVDKNGINVYCYTNDPRIISGELIHVLKGKFGRKLTPEHVEKVRQKHLGRKMTEEAKKQVSASKMGSKRTQESKDKQSASIKAKQPTICPHCNKFKLSHRFHFDNCKYKII